MRHTIRATAMVATFCLVVAACTGSGATPSTAPLDTGSTGSTPTAGEAPADTTATGTTTPTAEATDTAPLFVTPAPTAAPPTPAPAPVRGQYLLYKTGIDITDGYRPQLWVIKADGTGNHKIADGPDEPMVSPPTHEIDATWYHDGSALHVVKYLTGNSTSTYCMPQITNIQIDSGSAQTINATLTNHDDNFLWSPNEEQIVYRHWVGEPNCVQNQIDDRVNLMMMNADGSGQHTIASNVTYVIKAWTPDGTALIGQNSDYTQAVRVNPATGSSTAIGPSNVSSIAVSPDGSGVAFVSSNRLHVVNSNGTGATDLGVASARDYGPVWSPNGTSLAFQRTIGSATKVVAVTLPSPNATLLYNTTSGLNGFPCWQPTGARVAMSLNGGPMVVVNATGTGAAQLAGTTEVHLLSWQP